MFSSRTTGIQCCSLTIFSSLIGLVLENLAGCVSSSASAQLQQVPQAVAALGQPLVDTTAAARRVLLVGSIQLEYCAAPV